MRKKGDKDKKQRKTKYGDLPWGEIIIQYKSGRSVNALAIQYGTSPAAMKKWLVKLGVFEPDRMYSHGKLLNK